MCCWDQSYAGLHDPDVVTDTHVTSNGDKIYFTDVAIIGNGPSGMSLSAMLAGYTPYYNDKNWHAGKTMHSVLERNSHIPLYYQDLKKICETVTANTGGRSNNPMAVLMDYLQRPDLDIGHEHPSCLTWSYEPLRAVPHVVLGKGSCGGSWQSFPGDFLTLSFGEWLDLPAYSLTSFLHDKPECIPDCGIQTNNRVHVSVIQKYYASYPHQLGTKKHFFDFCEVMSVRRLRWSDAAANWVSLSSGDDFYGLGECSRNQNSTNKDTSTKPEEVWEIRGYHPCGMFTFRAKHVVLASGTQVKGRLRVQGEDEPWIKHSLESAVRTLVKCPPPDGVQKPIVVIGAGLTASDTIVQLLHSDTPVVHVFRRSPRDPQVVMSRLAKKVYPEYNMVSALMKGKRPPAASLAFAPRAAELYTPYPNATVTGFSTVDGERFVDIVVQPSDDKGRRLESEPEHRRSIAVSGAVVLVGYYADLSYLPSGLLSKITTHPPSRVLIDGKANSVLVDPFTARVAMSGGRSSGLLDGHASIPGLYALGPLVGDMFVRFLLGGAVAAAGDLQRIHGVKRRGAPQARPLTGQNSVRRRSSSSKREQSRDTQDSIAALIC